jgi:hypothetical protein
MTTPHKIHLRPVDFTVSNSLLSVTKSWVTNNHWIIHKSLLIDPLPWLTIDTAQDWLTQHNRAIETEPLNTEERINEILLDWSKGLLVPAPDPEPGIYDHHLYNYKARAIAYTLPPEIRERDVDVPLYCVRSLYYKAFRPYLTHMLYNCSVGVATEDLDRIMNTTLCNEDLTFLLRPLRPSDDVRRIK